MESIKDLDYKHAERAWKDFGIRNLGDHHNHMYVKSDNLVLANVFENFRGKCLDINELYPAHFHSAQANMAGILKENYSKTRITNRH